MSGDTLAAHLATGTTSVARAWSVERTDGVVLGFTDHDRPLQFDGITFRPDSGLSARALASTTGLSVNNSETVGVLSADAITEADINAGRYDGIMGVALAAVFAGILTGLGVIKPIRESRGHAFPLSFP